MCNPFYILPVFLDFLKRKYGREGDLLNFTSYCLKNRGNLTVTFGRNCFYVMISTDELSESLQPRYIIMMCEVPQLRCDSFPHRHIVFNFYNKVY